MLASPKLTIIPSMSSHSFLCTDYDYQVLAFAYKYGYEIPREPNREFDMIRRMCQL